MMASEGGANKSARAGPILMAWAVLVVALNAVLWGSGFRERELVGAVERGAARAESAGVGEVDEGVVREAIRLQRETRTFWGALILLADFGFEPLMPAARTLTASTLIAAFAAVSGRKVRFGEALAGCAAAQGFWVAGLAARVGLMVALRRPEVETSLALFLPAGAYPAATWLAIRQVDAFAILGWAATARVGWRLGQSGPAPAVAMVLGLAAIEAAARVALAAAVGAGMRLAIEMN